MDGLEQSNRAQGRRIPSILGHRETDLDMTLRAKVVDFGGFHVIDEVTKLLTTGQIAIVKKQARLGIVGIVVNVI
jgi:hypothetical protein